MAKSKNLVILIGNLGKDPETKTSKDGNKIVNMAVATTENWKDKTTGEKKESTDWHNVIIYNQGLCALASYAKKGSKVCVEGKLKTRKWSKDGVDHYVTEVIIGNFDGDLMLLDGKGDTSSKHESTQEGQEAPDDKIPFN